MSVVIIDGRVRVQFCTAIATIGAPTTTELNAGTSLELLITPDGLDINVGTNKVDTSNLGSTFTTNRAGRKTPEITVTFHHDSPTDTAWNLLPYRTVGFLVVRRGIDRTTAYATGDKLGVYPVESGEGNEVKPKPDGTWDFMIPLFVTADPNQRAVVA
jgi:hypothetical protein